MTRIDFYILPDNAPQAAPLFACRLSEKAWKQGHRVFIHAGSGAQLKQLDDLLWTFQAGSFLPHAVYRESGSTEPVLLGDGIDPTDEHDVLVNLSDRVPAFFSRFDRVAELVGSDEASRTAARERYRFYQDRGYSLETHKL
jgi:DNA polymerase-3 subunit chi